MPKKGCHMSDAEKLKRREAGKKYYIEHPEARQQKAEVARGNTHMLGRHLSVETRRKLSEASVGRVSWCRGKVGCWSAETLLKRSLSCKKHYANHPEARRQVSERFKGKLPWTAGKALSEETRRRISEAQKRCYAVHPERRQRVSEALRGKHPTVETRKKLSEAHLGKSLTLEHRKKISERRLRQRLPCKDTTIEVDIQDELTRRGVAFEKHKAMVGQPDIVVGSIACFLDGCYFHACPEHFPKAFPGKRERDARITGMVVNMGYIVLRFWEHDIRMHPGAVADRIVAEATWLGESRR